MNTDNQTNEKRLAQICAASMAIIAGLIRLIPHPWNFTPIAGIGLFGGARLRSWWAYVLPLAIMAVSDLLLWGIKGHADLTLLTYAFNPWVYGSFLFAVLCGRLLLRNGSAARIVAVSLLVSVQFFLATNFSAWLTLSAPLTRADGTVMAPLYTRDLSGLVTCYIAALPFADSDAPPLGFFGNQLVGDLFYTGILFGAYALLRRGVLVPRRLGAPTVARTS